MQADRWPRCSVLEQMDVLAVEESYGLVGVLLGERLDSGGSTAVDGGSPFGQNAVDDDECATVAAVIMPTGVLTGQPGDQPGVNVAVDVQWDSTSRRRVELHQTHPERPVGRGPQSGDDRGGRRGSGSARGSASTSAERHHVDPGRGRS